MESAVSFAPLRPADFVNFAGRGGVGQGLLFAGRGGAACFSAGRGGASIPAIRAMSERRCLLGGHSKDIIDFGHGPLDFEIN